MTDVDPLLGRTLAGRYRLISCLGTGGMSTVYLSRHALIDRLSAIKVLRPELAIHAEHRERFLREARAVNRINHPNIVEISDYGEAQINVGAGRSERRDVVYLVMEYIPGETLSKLLVKGPVPETRLVPIALQVASALARAHQTGVIHRDVKPENVLLVSRRDWVDLVKLTDFGVARMQLAKSLPMGGLSDQVVGTPGFVAPEYLVGETTLDGRADLYSLGVVMYEALCGSLPFDAATTADLLTLPLTEDPIPLRTRNPEVSEGVEAVVMRCLHRRADERPLDAFAFIDELRRASPWAKNLVVDGSLPAGAMRPASAAPPDRVPRASNDVPVEPRTPARVVLGVAPPKWGEVPPTQIAVAWRSYFAAFDRIEAGRPDDPPKAIARILLERDPVVEALEAAVARLNRHQKDIDSLASRGRDFRDTLGRAIDTLAADLSRAHANTLALKSRRVDLHLRRRHEQDAGAADALLWEEAAVDDDMRKAMHIASDLGHQIATLQDELFRRNNAHEQEVHRTTGAIEGELAAMATMNRELEIMSTELFAYLQG
jgi:eukaryotic-like serine/threonine-protein kinase